MQVRWELRAKMVAAFLALGPGCGAGAASLVEPQVKDESHVDPWACGPQEVQVMSCGFGVTRQQGGASLCMGALGAQGELEEVTLRALVPGDSEHDQVYERTWSGEDVRRVRWRGELDKSAAWSVRVELPAALTAQWTWTAHEDRVRGERVVSVRRARPLNGVQLFVCRRSNVLGLEKWATSDVPERLPWSELW